MTYILKTATVTGLWAPARGEHREYTSRVLAVRDAQVLADVFGLTVAVVRFRDDRHVSYHTPDGGTVVLT